MPTHWKEKEKRRSTGNTVCIVAFNYWLFLFKYLCHTVNTVTGSSNTRILRYTVRVFSIKIVANCK